MLYLWLGMFKSDTKIPKYISYPGYLFDDEAVAEWFEDEWTIKVISEIDSSTCLGMYNIRHTVFGGLNYRQLSSGAKLLIAAKFCRYVYNGDKMGDNCFPLVLELSRSMDVYLTCSYHVNKIPDDIKAYIVNSGKVVTNKVEFLYERIHHIDDVYKRGMCPDFENMCICKK